jgi:LacI family transcriptional regulator
MSSEPAERRRARRPTMREVAAVAGVSLSTVSRVVNGGDGVRDDLAVRVRDAVELLGYRHNLTARTLRRADRQSSSIGLIFEDVSNPFFGAVHRGVEDVARERGILTLVGSSDEEPDRERELAEAFSARGVDGLIVASAVHDSSYLLRERAAGIALVFVDRPPSFVDADAVVSDNAGGARTAVEHLIAAGHRRIGFLGDRPDVYTAAERLRGYRETLAQHGLAEDLDVVRHPQFRGIDAYQTTCELLRRSNPPTAIFAAQNLISVGVIRALHALGLHHEVALVSFDDILLADAVEPGITVMAQDPHALGRTAAELLFARLDGDDGPSRHVVLPTQLIERGSGELAP